MSTVDLSDARWHKSSYSGGAGNDGDCVEVAVLTSAVAVRDTKSPAGALVFSRVSWGHFLRKVPVGP